MSRIDEAIAKHLDIAKDFDLDEIRQDAQLILDGVPCKKPWKGTKPGCTRDKSQKEPTTKQKKAVSPKSTKPKKEQKAPVTEKAQPKIEAKKMTTATPTKKVDMLMTNIVDTDSILGADKFDKKTVDKIVSDMRITGAPPFVVPVVRSGLEDFEVVNHPSAIALVQAVKEFSKEGSPDRMAVKIFKSMDEANVMAKYLPDLR